MSEKEVYVSIKPQSEFLRKYIAYYYFNISKAVGYEKRFIFYPHYKNALTVYKNASAEIINGISTTKPDSSRAYAYIYTGIDLKNYEVSMQAPFNKIGVTFQPLGINHFLNQPLAALLNRESKYNFNHFGTPFDTVLNKVYNQEDFGKKGLILDAFFLKQFQDFEELRLLKAVDHFFKGNFSIQQVSEALKVNRKTLQRLFRKHLCCSPKDYANLIKFRNALTQYQEATEKPQLSSLAYDQQYYDQSDFIKNFKKLTGFNPKQMLGSLTHFGKEDTFWTVIE